jgi:hypothetical protein
MESRLAGSYLTDMQELRGQHKTLPQIVEFFLAKVSYVNRNYINFTSMLSQNALSTVYANKLNIQ